MKKAIARARIAVVAAGDEWSNEMRNIVSQVHAALSFLALAVIIAQFFLAGPGVFGAEPYDARRINGFLIGLTALLLLAFSLIGRLGRVRSGMSAALALLMIVQIALIESGQPWIEAIHPVLALPIMGVSFQLAIRGRDDFETGHARSARENLVEPQESPGL